MILFLFGLLLMALGVKMLLKGVSDHAAKFIQAVSDGYHEVDTDMDTVTDNMKR